MNRRVGVIVVILCVTNRTKLAPAFYGAGDEGKHTAETKKWVCERTWSVETNGTRNLTE